MNEVVMKAYAKINLTLDVLRKNEIGYHNVEMVMQQVSMFDDVILKKIPKGIEVICDNDDVPTDQTNIVYQVAERTLHMIDGGVSIEIQKRIPVMAGLAGGSSDGAATMMGLNLLYDLNLSVNEMMKMTEDIGKDIPFCIMGGCANATGMGEILQPIESLADCYVVLCTPNVSVSTKEAYESLQVDTIQNRPDTEQMVNALKKGDYTTICKSTINVFEEGVCRKYPVILNVKNKMFDNGADSVCMSGSGPSVFALFKELEKAEQACNYLKQFFEHSYVVTPIQK